MEEGTNMLFIKITNESILKEEKKAYEIKTLFNMREIEAAKSCIKNHYNFPPENYFENTFIPKLTKDEESGEINFWTKNFYRRLLRGYFKEEEKKLQEKNDFRNINEKIIAEKNEAKLMKQKQNVEYDNVINNQIRKQMDYMEEKEYRRKEDKKNRYKQALDKQIDQQKIRKQREYDIEHGNF